MDKHYSPDASPENQHYSVAVKREVTFEYENLRQRFLSLRKDEVHA
jgi:hypothetical protein